MTPRPESAHAPIADSPTRYARRLPDDRRAFPSPGRSGNINTNNNRRQVGPLQAIAPGPVQAIVFMIPVSACNERTIRTAACFSSIEYRRVVGFPAV